MAYFQGLYVSFREGNWAFQMPDQHDVLVLRRWHTCPMTSAIQGNAISERNTETLGNICWCKKHGWQRVVGWFLAGWLRWWFSKHLLFSPLQVLGEMIQFHWYLLKLPTSVCRRLYMEFTYCWKNQANQFDVVDIPVFIGFDTSQVVQDLFHQQ